MEEQEQGKDWMSRRILLDARKIVMMLFSACIAAGILK